MKPTQLEPSTSSGRIHFRIINEGDEKRVLPFQTTVLWGSSSFGENIAKDTSPWTCDRCQYENFDADSKLCSICGYKRDKNNFRNNKNEQNINVLQANHTEMNITTVDDAKAGNRQSLSSQSLHFKDLLEDRDIGGASLRRSIAESSFGLGAGWACPDCTYVNLSSMHLTCDVCGQEKPHNIYENSITKAFDSVSSCSPSVTEILSESSFVEKQLKEYQKYENIARETENLAQTVKSQLAFLKGTDGKGRKTSVLDLKQDLNGILHEGTATLEALEKRYEEDRKQYDEMVKYQADKETKIIAKEGCTPSDVMNSKATQPGVQLISPEILEWHGQQRMLDDWKIQLDERQIEIKMLRENHTETMNRILS